MASQEQREQERNLPSLDFDLTIQRAHSAMFALRDRVAFGSFISDFVPFLTQTIANGKAQPRYDNAQQLIEFAQADTTFDDNQAKDIVAAAVTTVLIIELENAASKGNPEATKALQALDIITNTLNSSSIPSEDITQLLQGGGDLFMGHAIQYRGEIIISSAAKLESELIEGEVILFPQQFSDLVNAQWTFIQTLFPNITEVNLLRITETKILEALFTSEMQNPIPKPPENKPDNDTPPEQPRRGRGPIRPKPSLGGDDDGQLKIKALNIPRTPSDSAGAAKPLPTGDQDK